MPSMREIDTDTFEKADVIVIDTKHLEGESGDVIAGNQERTIQS